MASSISAGTTSATALVHTADTTGALQLATNNGTVAVTVDTSQNVGIGTTSPNKKLEVVSAGEIIRATSSTGANDQVISIKNNSGTADTSTNIFFADRYAATSYASSYIRGTASGTSALIFATGGTNFTNIYDAGAPTERMRIDSSGNVLVATTSLIGNGKICSLYDSSTSTGLAIKQSNNSAGTLQEFYNHAGTLQGYIANNNNGTVSYVTTSDYRLKENVIALTGALNTVLRLKPCQFNFIGHEQSLVGFIAHEVQEVVPQAVYGEKDAVDSNNVIKPQGIDASHLVATLTAAIQEQQALITQQAAAIEALTTRITALEGTPA